MNKNKTYKQPNRINWVKTVLRNASKKWPARNQAIKEANIERGIHICKICNTKIKRRKFHLDHKEPVIPIQGAVKHPIRKDEDDLNVFVERLLCDLENWQVLCIKCHESKTEIETEMRSFYKKKQKGKKK